MLAPKFETSISEDRHQEPWTKEGDCQRHPHWDIWPVLQTYVASPKLDVQIKLLTFKNVNHHHTDMWLKK